MSNPFQEQVGGTHYKDLAIQPTEYCQRNRLGFCESSVVKYVTRHRLKNGKQDIQKAIHFLQLLLEMEYPESGKGESPLPEGFQLPEGFHPGQVLMVGSEEYNNYIKAMEVKKHEAGLGRSGPDFPKADLCTHVQTIFDKALPLVGRFVEIDLIEGTTIGKTRFIGKLASVDRQWITTQNDPENPLCQFTEERRCRTSLIRDINEVTDQPPMEGIAFDFLAPFFKGSAPPSPAPEVVPTKPIETIKP